MSDFLALRGDLCWNCPSLKILPGGQGVVWRPGSLENAEGKIPGSILVVARPSRTFCLILMMRRMISMRIIRMMRMMKMMKMMKMKMNMRMRINLRMIKDKDGKR